MLFGRSERFSGFNFKHFQASKKAYFRERCLRFLRDRERDLDREEELESDSLCFLLLLLFFRLFSLSLFLDLRCLSFDPFRFVRSLRLRLRRRRSSALDSSDDESEFSDDALSADEDSDSYFLRFRF